MKIAIQSCLVILSISWLLGPTSADGQIRGAWQNQLLPGQQEFMGRLMWHLRVDKLLLPTMP